MVDCYAVPTEHDVQLPNGDHANFSWKWTFALLPSPPNEDFVLSRLGRFSLYVPFFLLQSFIPYQMREQAFREIAT